MKKIFEKPTLKKILLVLAVLFIIILAPITMPLMFLGGCFGIWRFTKRKPNIQKRNIAIAVTIVGILGTYAVGKLTPDVIKEQTEQSQVTKFTSNSSSTSSSSSQTSSSTASSSKKEKQEKERKEKELKEAQKQKQEEEKKAREEQARKEAETKKIVEEANQAVQQLETNQVAENISPAQAAVERVADPTTKSNLTDRIGRVQNAINQRAEEARLAEQARQEAERQAAEQQQTRTVYVARNGTADVYWYSMENMPSNTRFDKVVSMTEADAIASGKRHTSKE
ncbi:hypothetical protein KQH74_01690 [Streptococcus sanguinis]|jgi:hypothetical protein|uniref:Uncharacterized protein n=1 Tax=Streptococcus sanguinis TaxID=1305 RepID=A0ABD7JRE6_STRSA|nr:hypothetical protein [Streptococcus sanguinis]PLA63900.1 hypothetical protein CYK23_08865 [Streptococcus salivarius]RSI24837.1 hypothetical protein D8881_06550 [Streptococcus sanguinis]RSI42030.1 hypothetical protein D8875_03035 [Streptococcus sanguinis]